MKRHLTVSVRKFRLWAAWGGVLLTLLGYSSSGQTISNPSFEQNTYTVEPGYIGDNSPITGWTASEAYSAGLNPSGPSSQFADNGAVPEGRNVAFILTGGSLTTTLSGLTVGTTYKVSFRANAMTTQAPNASLSLDGQEPLLVVTVYPVGSTNPYSHIAFEFTATAPSQELTVRNDAGVDSTLLVDDFRITPSSGGWEVAEWTGDSDVGADTQYVYTHAYSFGGGADAVINGVLFDGVGGGSPGVAGKFSTTFLGNVFNNDANAVTGNSTVLARDFVYGGNVPAGNYQSITLQGLTPSTEYVATIYSVGFDSPGPTIRWATFSAGEDRLTINQDQFGNDQGIRMSYRYTAGADGTVTLRIAPINPSNVSIHVYGFANREAASRNVAPIVTIPPRSVTVAQGLPVTFHVNATGFPAPTYQWRFNGSNLAGANAASYTVSQASGQNVGHYDVVVSNSVGSVTSVVARLTVGLPMVNSSFEADSFLSWPGYSGENVGNDTTPPGPNGPITGWILGDENGGGINPIADGAAPFADNGIIPHGTNVVFLQANTTLGQTVSGLTAGSQYYLHFYENARTPGIPYLEAQMNGVPLVEAHPITPVGGNPYREVYSDVFTADTTSFDLSFVKSNPLGGDTTALIDNVAIVPVPAGTAPLVVRDPETRQSLGGGSVAFSVQAIGSLPLAFQWLKSGLAIPGATQSSLTLTNLQSSDEAEYSVRVTNTAGSASSAAARLTVALPGVFGTGVGTNGQLLAAGEIDPHYRLISSPDEVAVGPEAFVVNEGWPIQSGVWLLNGPDSKWIGPQADQSGAGGNAEGDYSYETTFDLTGFDVSKVQLVGGWATDNAGLAILLNGLNTGIPGGGFSTMVPFTITNGLVAGTNKLEFKMNNAPATPNPTALRVDLKALLIPGASAGPRLQVSRNGLNVSISWTPVSAGQKLQRAEQVTGPWMEIPNASSPYSTNGSTGIIFYRIAQ